MFANHNGVGDKCFAISHKQVVGRTRYVVERIGKSREIKSRRHNGIEFIVSDDTYFFGNVYPVYFQKVVKVLGDKVVVAKYTYSFGGVGSYGVYQRVIFVGVGKVEKQRFFFSERYIVFIKIIGKAEKSLTPYGVKTRTGIERRISVFDEMFCGVIARYPVIGIDYGRIFYGYGVVNEDHGHGQSFVNIDDIGRIVLEKRNNAVAPFFYESDKRIFFRLAGRKFQDGDIAVFKDGIIDGFGYLGKKRICDVFGEYSYFFPFRFEEFKKFAVFIIKPVHYEFFIAYRDYKVVIDEIIYNFKRRHERNVVPFHKIFGDHELVARSTEFSRQQVGSDFFQDFLYFHRCTPKPYIFLFYNIRNDKSSK